MARSFNGTTDLITADGAGVYGAGGSGNVWSVSFWVNGAAGTTPFFYSEGGGVTSVTCAALGAAASGALRWFVRSTSATVTDVSGTTAALDGTWHHVAMTRDGASPSRHFIAYVDGVQDLTHPDGLMTTGQTILSFGVLRRSTTTNFFNGTLAEMANWTRVLSAQEIAGLASGLPASYFGPKHYWPLWGTDSPEPDIGSG